MSRQPLPAGPENPQSEPGRAHLEGCMVCGQELEYGTAPVEAECAYCGRKMETHIRCPEGHFVCDDCHRGDALAALQSLCLTTDSRDPLALALQVMDLPFVPMHGPEHHAMVPGVLVAACRNLLPEAITDRDVREALRRGTEISGGACGRLGVCGAAAGAGIAWSVIAGATPLSVRERGQALGLTGRALEAISRHGGPRCCKRDSFTALETARDFLEEALGIKFDRTVDVRGACRYHHRNRQCIRVRCPYFPGTEPEPPTEFGDH